MTFKQKYLHEQGPFPIDFDRERVEVMDRIMMVLNSCPPNDWNVRAISPLCLDSYKQIYGLTSQQLTRLLQYFLDILSSHELTCEASLIILKTLNRLREFRISITGLNYDNLYFLGVLKKLGEEGIKFPLKSMDSYMEELIKAIRSFAKFGQQCYQQALQMAVLKRDNKYIALFVRSIKSEATAQDALDRIFAESSIWDRDSCFFHILDELTYKFPQLPMAKYYQTLFHQIIKVITCVIDPSTQEQIKKLTNEDPYIGSHCILKSVANILVNLLRPTHETGWKQVWSCIQRIFSMISSTMDHSHQVQFMNDFLIFMKQFVKVFIFRYREERKIHQLYNEDYIQQKHGEFEESKLVITGEYIQLFAEIWLPLIPELLYLEDGDVRASKILSDLAMFEPERYLAVILEQTLAYLDKDLTIISIYTPKMTILFLQEFIINQFPNGHQFSLLISCCNSLMAALDKLGISQNLDILELVLRVYMYFSEEHLDLPIVNSLTSDIIEVMLTNMDAMSINLQGTEGQQAQLYIDFRNIYISFLLRLSSAEIRQFSDKILFKIHSKVPQHRQAYEFIVVGLCYVNPALSRKILDHSYKQIITYDPTDPFSNNKSKSGGSASSSASHTITEQLLPYHLDCSLNIKNQQHLRWYASMIQCAYQYHPDNILRDWDKLETIAMVMLREWERTSIFDWGLDLIFNLLLGLTNVHLGFQEFNRKSNCQYATMKDLKWKNTSPECIALLLKIKERFHDSLSRWIYKKYGNILVQSEKAKKLKGNAVIIVETPEPSRNIQISEAMSEQLDSILVPSVPTAEDLQEKRIMNKVLSIQYSVFSALQLRAPYLNDPTKMPQIAAYFIKELGDYRRQSIQYLKDFMCLLAHYNSLWHPDVLKVFHFYWREAHDELFFSAAITATNEKLHPFFYPIQFKRKELFHNSFLIINEMYLTYMMRIELFSNLSPTAYLNNPQFLNYLVPFTFSSALQSSVKSHLPINVNPHTEFHAKLLDICRLKVSIHHPSSYLNKYQECLKDPKRSTEKEKYIGGLRLVINNFRKTQSALSLKCCIQDNTSWYAIVELLQIYPFLEKKSDRLALIEILYMIIIFTFDFKSYLVYQLNESPKNLTEKSAAEFIEVVLHKLKAKDFTHKDSTAFLLIIICFSEFLPLQHELHAELINFAFTITGLETVSLSNMGKTFVFRYLNRFIKEKKLKITRIPNTPVQRSFEDFLVYRHVGGETDIDGIVPAPNIISYKIDNYYYPLKELKKIEVKTLDPLISNQNVLLDLLNDSEKMNKLFRALCKDTELKQDDNEVDLSFISEDEPKRINANGHKLLNYILDANPQKMDIFMSFVDNFSVYPICFYHRFFRKILVLGDQKTIETFKEIGKKYSSSQEKQEVKLSQFVLSQLLPFSFNDSNFYEFYSEFLVQCSKENFDFANNCLLVVFCKSWRANRIIFKKIIERLRRQKGPSRLRHLQVFNNYILCTGRFGLKEAVDGIKYLLQGIEEGSDQVSQLIVSMLIACFIIPINFKDFDAWVKEPLEDLVRSNRVYKLNEETGYEIHPSVREILEEIVRKTKCQKNLQSKNLKTYSKISIKILSSITVYRFNDEFYRLLKDIIIYIVNKPVENAGEDDQIIMQLKDSEYPQKIFDDILEHLIPMDSGSLNVSKKKLKLLEGIVINRSFCNNWVRLPDIFSRNPEKSIVMDHIVAISNMARIMKTSELTNEVEELLANANEGQENKMSKVFTMMSYLLATGNRPLIWRQKLLNEIVKLKKTKVVKQFVSVWWKGRSAETEEEQRLYMLVRGVENPYSYFA